MKRLNARTILVIEDDADSRELTELWLDRQGATVLTAATGAEGLALHATADVVICDLSLQDMDPTELLRKLKDRVPPPRVIAVSGHVHADARGFDAFVPKPLNLETLMRHLVN